MDNNLTRDTPFVANIKFRNILPELACDPKMIGRIHDAEALSRFHLTNAEENLRPELVMAPDPSVLSAMHMHNYCFSEPAGDMHPDDRALIDGQLGARAQRGNVAWLMKTRCWDSSLCTTCMLLAVLHCSHPRKVGVSQPRMTSSSAWNAALPLNHCSMLQVLACHEQCACGSQASCKGRCKSRTNSSRGEGADRRLV
jgi:hypothetical protein